MFRGDRSRPPIYVALEPVDMRMGDARLGALVREGMRAVPRSKALLVFVGKPGDTLKELTWDGTARSSRTRSSTREVRGRAQALRLIQGFLQADASNGFDILERGPPIDEDIDSLKLVGCWAHTRRYFFEAAVCKYQVGIQGSLRIRANSAEVISRAR